MLQDIKFCSCSALGKDKMHTKQCIIFRFTDRALKMLSPQFLDLISTREDNIEYADEGIPIDPENETCDIFFKIHRIKDNYWRMSTQHLDPFLRCLFRYLPAYYVSHEGDPSEGFHCSFKSVV